MDPTLPPEPPPAPTPDRRRRPDLRPALAFYGVLLLLVLPDLLAQAAGMELKVVALGLGWSELFAMLLPAFVAAEGSNLRAGSYLGLERPRALPVALGALVGVAGYVPAAGIAALWLRVLPRALLERLHDVSRIFEGPLASQVAITAAAVVLAPLCEEVAFRGYLQRTLARAIGPAWAIALTALLFALRHLDPLRFGPLLPLGALFGWLAWRSGSIWPAIAAHAANNAIASAAALFGLAERPAVLEAPALGDALYALLGGGALVAALAFAFHRATPAPPAPHAALPLRDPADPSTRFLASRVPYRLARTASLGALALFALLASAAWSALRHP